MPPVSSQFGMWDSSTHLLLFHVIISMQYCAAFSHFVSTVKHENRSIFAIIYFFSQKVFCIPKPNQNEIIKKHFAHVNGERGSWACCCWYRDYTLITETLGNIWGTGRRTEISRDYISSSSLRVALTCLCWACVHPYLQSPGLDILTSTETSLSSCRINLSLSAEKGHTNFKWDPAKLSL